MRPVPLPWSTAAAPSFRPVFPQSLTPVAGAVVPSVVVAALPIVTVLAMLGAFRRPAWQASVAGLVVGLAVAIALSTQARARRRQQRRGVRHVAGPGDRVRRAPAVQRLRRVRTVRRLVRL